MLKVGSKIKILKRPEVQIKLHDATGYITDAAIKIGRSGYIYTIVINDPKRPSIDGTTTYMDSKNVEVCK